MTYFFCKTPFGGLVSMSTINFSSYNFIEYLVGHLGGTCHCKMLTTLIYWSLIKNDL